LSRISVYTGKKRFNTARDLYGVFFEDINRAGDGGLYPEMLRNRAFEDSIPPERCVLDEDGKLFTTPEGWRCEFNHGEGLAAWRKNLAPTPVPAWYAYGGAEMSLGLEDTLNQNRRASLAVDFTGDEGGVYNIGFCGMYFKKDAQYRFYLFAKAPDGPMTLKVSLQNAEEKVYASQMIEVSGTEYKRYDAVFTVTGEDANGRLSISSLQAGRVVLGFSSLMPAHTYKGRINGLRADLVEKLKAMRPKFMRFPGGCIVEGFTRESAMRFPWLIGEVWERPSYFNLWCYRSTNGLGYHEYLTLCEDIGAEAMYVVNCGLSCQGRRPELFEGEELNGLLEEAIAAVEYAIAPVTNKWGAMRAKFGHPEPFPLKYLEIGNENHGEPYNTRYKLFYDAIKARFPQLIYISNTHTERDGLPTEMADEHFYSDVEFFAAHTGHYDHYDRGGPEIFVGEYAVTVDRLTGSHHCALGEAAFLTGVERNQDIVTLSSYAPTFLNVDYMSWYPNLIEFNNRESFGIPSYHMLTMFGANRGDRVVELSVDTPSQFSKVSGCMGFWSRYAGASFKNIKMDGSPCEKVEVMPSTFSVVGGYDQKDGVYTANGNHCRAVCGNRDAVDCTAEADIQFPEDGEVSLSIWNHYIAGGYLMEGDVQWNQGGLYHYDWVVSGNKSRVLTSKGFRGDPVSEEIELALDRDGFNHYKVVAGATRIRCYLNGQLVHDVPVRSTPVLCACATVQDDPAQVILKIVNLSDAAQKTTISLDCPVGPEGALEIMQSDDPYVRNSFDRPDAVAPVAKPLAGLAQEFVYDVPAYSINVLRLPMKQ